MTTPIAALALLAPALALLLVAVQVVRRKNLAVWLPAYFSGLYQRRRGSDRPIHIMFCFVDHFEPQWGRVDYQQECARVARWRSRYPELCARHRDADGRPPVHSFFYPAEEYRSEHLEPLVELCRLRLGEIEIHLHHHDDTAEGLRKSLREFNELLMVHHDCLARDAVTGQARWAFIHGNWALDNSRPDGKYCGVNNELIVLREEGCYADFTLPCAPDPSQTRTINSIYYATDDPERPKSHDRGTPVAVGVPPTGDLMIVQGPLGLDWGNRKYGLLPRIENADVRASFPPSPARVDHWVRTAIHVTGRTDWRFIKVHTHGTQERDEHTLLGQPMHAMHDYLESRYNDGQEFVLHYVSARELYNIVKAAEAGMTGDPGKYRDFLIGRPAYAVQSRSGTAKAP